MYAFDSMNLIFKLVDYQPCFPLWDFVGSSSWKHNTYVLQLILIKLWNNLIDVTQGWILNLKFIFGPPPFWFFFPQMKFNIWRGALCRRKIFSFFFLPFWDFKINWGKNMHTFYQLGKKIKKICISPPFFIPFQ